MFSPYVYVPMIASMPTEFWRFSALAADPAPHLYQLARDGHAEGRRQFSEYAISQLSPHWLALAASFPDPEAIYTYAIQQADVQTQKQQLQRSAHLGHGNSQYELAMLSQSQPGRLRWLTQAAESGHQAAIISLYQWYQLQQDHTLMLEWLAKAAEYDGVSAVLLGRILWQQQAHERAKLAFERAVQFGNDDATRYLEHIQQFWRKSPHQVQSLSEYGVERPQCVIRIQTLTTELDGVVKATTLLSKFADDAQLASLPICFNPPLLVEPHQLECEVVWHQSGRTNCNTRQMVDLVSELDFSHLVVITEQGKAYVNNGIMFLDLADTYQVFVHELAHFAGFVDEYPLSSGMAENVCGVKNAPNLIVMEP